MKPYGVPVTRCNGGEPIVAPTERWWESGVTFNAAALYLEPSAADEPILRALFPEKAPDDPDLAEGIVAIHYRARPEQEPGVPFPRSYIGLAVFTPDFRLLYRSPEPVFAPSAGQDGCDHLGVEDPRITRFGDTFYMVYTGLAFDAAHTYRPQLCLATSRDLLRWERLGPLRGDVNRTYNKDGVLFPDRIDGRYLLLHRPYWEGLPQSEFVMHLAVGESLAGETRGGEWRDCGEVLRAYPNPHCHSSWVGAGSVPIPMGNRRYAVIYHTGNYLNDVDREYDLDVAVFDLNRLTVDDPSAVVTARLEPLMVPETEAELRSNSSLQVANVLFACGSYEYRDDLYIIYGGADTYTLAARVNRVALWDALERADLSNPFLASTHSSCRRVHRGDDAQ
jgi:predicted GH43/DUF377 family glycosyl hydrolase